MNNNWKKNISFIYLFLFIFHLSCDGSKVNKNVDSDRLNEVDSARVAGDGYANEEYLVRTHIPVISTYYMKGSIDEKYIFYMSFTVDSCKVDGTYNYEGKEKDIKVEGTIKDKEVRIEEKIYHEQKREYVSNGAYFAGVFDYDKGVIIGTWHSADGKRALPFKIENFYNTGYPQFDFKVNLKKETDESGYVSLNIDELYVRNKRTGSESIFSIDTHPLESTYAIFQQDFNFDGYPDIAMMEFIPSYPPNKFLFWMYDPKDAMYYPSDILDEVYTLPEINYIDSTTTTVTIWHNQIHTQTYKFDGSKWILESSAAEDIGE